MRFSREYLLRLSEIETPEEFSHEEPDVCHQYALLRNYAKDLLRAPQNERSRIELSNLIISTGVVLT